MEFDFDSFFADFHAYRHRQGHSIEDVAKLTGRAVMNLRELFRRERPDTTRVGFMTILILADYADLALDDYRKVTTTDAYETRIRNSKLERSRTAGGYPVLRSTRAG